ncbi:MAG: translocation/assembly module TamB [Flavobacteriales bacterium]|nr:translocation/assembly module TamB [Flavobacteriales bacterium]
MASPLSRWLKRIARWTGITVFTVLLLAILIAGLLAIPSVQTRVASYVADWASERTGADIRIGAVSIALDGSVRLGGVFVGDLRGDTLFAIPELDVKGVRFSTERRLLQLSALELHGVRFNLRTAKDDAHSNLTNLLAKLTTGDTSATGDDWTVRCTRFLIDGFHFSFHDERAEQRPFGVDFKHIDIPDAHLHGTMLSVVGDSIHAAIQRISLSERSGLRVDRLKGLTTVSGHGVMVGGMYLRTPRSRVTGDLVMASDDWDAFNEFTQQVRLKLDLDSSLMDMADISWFAPELQGIELPLRISGKVHGTIAELKGKGLAIGFGERSLFRGSAELSGLPYINETFMLLDIVELRTTNDDLHHLPIPPFTSGEMLQLPEEMELLGSMSYAGRFTGFLRAFTAQGRASCALGDMRTNISYTRDTITDHIMLSGRAATESFQLGRLLGTRTIGAMAADVRLNANGRTLRTMKIDLDGVFPLFTLNNEALTGITATGHIERNLFNGELHARNDKLWLDFKGLADMRKRWPEVDFFAKVQHADLRELGFTRKPGYNTVSLDVAARGRLSPDSLRGSLQVSDISYCDEDGEHDLGDILLESDRLNGENVLRLDASFAQAEVVGTFLPTRLPEALAHVVYSVFPSLTDEVVYTHEEQRFSFQVVAKETEEILSLFIPGLVIDSGASVSGSFSTRTFDFDLTGDLPHAHYGAWAIDSVKLIADKTLDLLAFSARSTRQHVSDSLWFGGTAITGKAYQDELELELGWDESNSGTNGDLELTGEVRGMRSLTLDLLPSQLYFGRGAWSNSRVARFTIDSSTVVVDSLVLTNGAQRIVLDGAVSRDPLQGLSFELADVDLLNLAPLLDGPVLTGTIGGDGRLYDVYGAPYIVSFLCADTVKVSDKPVGDIRFAATWLEGQSALDLNGTLTRGPIKALDFTGRLGVAKGSALDMMLLLDRFDMALVNPYLPDGISDIRGFVTGKIKLYGTLTEPEIKGKVDLTDGGLRIDYLNTRYSFSTQVNIEPDMFTFDRAVVKDEEGHTATVGATVIHERLRNWNYDIWGSMTNMLVLNTTVAMNPRYYGKGYGTGEFGVSGSRGVLEINVDATTAPGTDIRFPVGGSTEVSPIGFIDFTAADTSLIEEEVDLSGVRLDMDIQVTPDARFELIFDPLVGDIMSGRGTGNMEMTVTPSGAFSMTGQVQVTDGDYLFTLRNVVNKRFQVQPGGRIVWYGDPFDAQLDLNAIYKVRASLYDIVPPSERTEAYKKRVPVDVVMHLTDKLMNPEITFQVRLPSVDESVKAQVASVLSTEQEMNRQVFALIVLNKFLQPPVYVGAGEPTGTGNVAGTTTSELLSNQVSNWLSGLSNDFDLGLNYRPGDNITQDELEVALSTQLFNERLLLSTNVGVQYGARASANAGNTLVGDFQLDYLLTDDGRLRLKAYSVTNDRNLNQADQAPTTQATGVAFREDFDSLGELGQKLLNLFRRSEKDRVFE